MSEKGIKGMVTVREAADRYGVTVSRMHQLIDTYDVGTVRVGKQLKLIPSLELKKIPKDRPTGKHLT